MAIKKRKTQPEMPREWTPQDAYPFPKGWIPSERLAMVLCIVLREAQWHGLSVNDKKVTRAELRALQRLVKHVKDDDFVWR